MNTYKCPKCETEFSSGTKFCEKCGCNLEVEFIETPTCPKCEKTFPTGTVFCNEDGAKLVSPERMIPKCVKCGKVYTDGTKFCPLDGGKIIPEALRIGIDFDNAKEFVIGSVDKGKGLLEKGSQFFFRLPKNQRYGIVGGCVAMVALVIILVGGNSIGSGEQGVVINNVRWATRNVDAPGRFARNPEDAGMFFQWNRRQGWAVTGSVRRWDSSYPEGTAWHTANDPCPRGWRLPTYAELNSLRSAGSIWTTLNGVNGRFFGTYPHRIFLPAAGVRQQEDGRLQHTGSIGQYWSSTAQYWGAGEYDWWNNNLWFDSGNAGPGICCADAHGFSVRCVAK